MSDEPELYVFDFSGAPAAQERREERARTRAESRRRYREHLSTALDLHGVAGDIDAIADIALSALTGWPRIGSGEECACSCHPRLPDSDLHDFGFACSCRLTQEERAASWDSWCKEEAYWASPEGRAVTAAEEAEEAELQVWLAAQPGVTVSSHGGFVPEQWRGSVDDHSFYFRERHDHWRIELDLRPSGRFANALRGTDPSGEMILEPVELEDGDIIAEGTTATEGYGRTPTERAGFIVNQIRTHLARISCRVHNQDLATIGALIGADVTWCPACGKPL